jgi:hypothetical protein
MYAVKLGFEIDSNVYSRGQRGKWITLSTSSPAYPQPVKEDRTDAPEVPAPAGHPPLTFVAGINIWTIHYSTHEYMRAAGWGGWANNATHEIWLDVEDQMPRVTLTHELMHAARQAAREGGDREANDNDGENQFVTPAAPAFYHILRDNPALMAWLTTKEKRKTAQARKMGCLTSTAPCFGGTQQATTPSALYGKEIDVAPLPGPWACGACGWVRRDPRPEMRSPPPKVLPTSAA